MSEQNEVVEEESLRESLEAALTESEGANAESSPPPETSKKPVSDDKALGDSDGARDTTVPDAKAAPDKTTKEPVEEAHGKEWDDRAPSSWSPKVREKWATVDPEVRAEIVRREQAAATGVQKLHQEYAPIKQFTESLSPYMQEASQLGINPAQHIHNTLAAERQLRAQDPTARFNALLNIADQYGIPIRQFLAGEKSAPAAPPPQQQQVLQDPRIQELLAFKEQYQESAVEREFARVANEEFIGREDIQDLMANLIRSGVATDIKAAYDKACLLHDEIRQVLDSRKGKETQNQALKQRQEAAALAGRAGMAGREVDVPGSTAKDDSIRGILDEMMREATGRI